MKHKKVNNKKRIITTSDDILVKAFEPQAQKAWIKSLSKVPKHLISFQLHPGSRETLLILFDEAFQEELQ